MPSRRTHLPVSEFLEDFITNIANFGNIGARSGVQIFDSDTRERTTQFLDQSRIIMEALAKDKASFRNALWKNSLGIPLVDNKEEEVFEKCPIFRRHSKLKITIVRGWENDADIANFDSHPVVQRMYYYKTPVELGPTLAATFPHMEVGRYPTDINTKKGLKNSVELYEEHKKGLGKLIESVEKTLRSS
jgi:hypothetical protein